MRHSGLRDDRLRRDRTDGNGVCETGVRDDWFDGQCLWEACLVTG